MFAKRLQWSHIDPRLIDWSQCVKMNSVLSDVLMSSTGSPKVSSSHTNMHWSHILKLADDSVIAAVIQTRRCVCLCVVRSWTQILMTFPPT